MRRGSEKAQTPYSSRRVLSAAVAGIKAHLDTFAEIKFVWTIVLAINARDSGNKTLIDDSTGLYM